MADFLEYQAIVGIRVPIDADGKPGTPQITTKFVREIKDTRKNKPKKVVRELTVQAKDETFL